MKWGITRVVITDSINGAGAWRFKAAKAKQPAANLLYRTIFARIGSPLLSGETQLVTTKAEFEAGYDYYLGIDVILTFANGQEATLQEKFLTYRKSTVTVEYMQNPQTGEYGDWFKMKPDYYFVGYDRLEKNSFQEWILLDWSIARQMTNQGLIPWEGNVNIRDGAKANFKYVPFALIPPECVVHGKWSSKEYIGQSESDLNLLKQIYREQQEAQSATSNTSTPAIGDYGEYRGVTPKQQQAGAQGGIHA